jgi:NTE family protein
MSQADPTVAVVLAGGGARGAYEAGALSVLLPVLEEHGLRPRIVIGTSVGALNASFLAANAHLPASQVAADALAVWESISWTEVAQPLLSVGTVLRLSGSAGEVLGVPGARLDSLLDPAPLRTSLRERVDFAQISRNVQAGDLDAVGVVATSAATNRSVVFHDGVASPPPSWPATSGRTPSRARARSSAASSAISSPLTFRPSPPSTRSPSATRVTPGKKRRVGQALINLGRQDARRWLGRSHDLDGLWHIAPSAAT